MPFLANVWISIDLSGILEVEGFWKTPPPIVNEMELVEVTDEEQPA